MAVKLNGADLQGIQVHKLPKDPNFSSNRLAISANPDTGKLYQVTQQQWINLLSANNVAYKGAAKPTDNPGTPSSPVFYSASEEGTYTNFKDSDGNGLEVSSGDGLVILSYDGTNWTKQSYAISLDSYLQKSAITSTQYGKNLFNKDTVTPGYVSSDGTINNGGTSYYYSDFIPVSQGNYISSGYGVNQMRFSCFYDSSKNVVTGGTDATHFKETIPSGVAFIRVSINQSAVDTFQFEAGSTATSYEPYQTRITSINGQDLVYVDAYDKTETYTKTEVDGITSNIEDEIPVVVSENVGGSKNLADPSKFVDGYFVEYSGSVIAYAAYGYTDYIAVTPGLDYTGYDGRNGMRKTCYYDSNKNVVAGGSTNSSTTFTAPSGVAFVRVSFFEDGRSTFQFEQASAPTAFVPFEPVIKQLVSVGGATLPDNNGGGTDVNLNTLTFDNSDKILFTGCSYDESVYTLKGKNWVNKLSNYTDWICANSGVSGYRIIDIADRLRQDISTYNLQPSKYKPTYITIANNGNEFFPGNGEDLDLYMEQVRIAVEVINQMGAKVILGTSHHANNNVWLESQLKGYADANKFPYMGIGRNGEEILSHAYAGFWGGSHPGVRINSFVWQEWLYYINQLPRPRKAIKIFRPRNTSSTYSTLNYDTIEQRAELFQEINCGEKSLAESDGSESYYDRLDEGTVVDPNDENNIIHNYTSQTNNNEYSYLITGSNIAFTNNALIELIIDKVHVDNITMQVTGDSGLSFYAKDNNVDTWVSAARDTALVFQVTKSVYDAFTDAVGTKYTSSNVKSGSVQFAYTGKLKSYAMGKGWFLCFNADSSVAQSDRVATSGTLVRVSDSVNVAFTAQKNPYRYDFTFFNSLAKPQGAFIALSDEVTYDNGVYTIVLDKSSYFQFDKVKLIASKSGSFNISGVSATYEGGITKPEYTKEIIQKDFGKEMIPVRGFDSNWTTTGGWTNESNLLVSMPSDVRDYPPYLSTTNHVELGFDSDGFPKKIYRDITLDVSGTDRRGWQKVLVRVVARLFPKIYNTDKTGDYYTSTPQITKTSYDEAVLCLGLGTTGTQPELVLRKPVSIGWSEIMFETTLPIVNGSVRLSLWRDSELSIENNAYPMQVYDVSFQVI